MKRARAWRTAKATATSVVLAVLAAMLPDLAHADTPASIWDRVRDPNVARRQALHAFAEQALSQDDRTPSLVSRDAALERARALLEAAEADLAEDVRLRFDLGELYQRLKRNEKAVAILTAAVKDAPDSPEKATAYELLAYAYAYLDRPREERDAYFAYLPLITDDRSRATAALNLAEAEMRLGNLNEAVARYREAFDLASAVATPLPSSQETLALATWGLAVALDRAGDPHGAENEAKLATQLDPGEALISHGKDVFFVPEYERYWYLALGLAEEAKAATEPHAAAAMWKDVDRLWTAYLGQAVATEKWLPLARAHLEKVKKLRAEADARAAKAPKPQAGFELYFP